MRTRLFGTMCRVLTCLTLLLVLVACGGLRSGSPEADAEAAFGIWAERAGMPFRKAHYNTISNDNTYATVRIVAEFRESAESDWLEQQADLECRKVSGEWQCDQYLNFQLTDLQKAELDSHIQATATAIADNAIANATIAAEEAKRGLETISVDSVSEIFYDDPESRNMQPRGWRVTIRNDDQNDHTVIVLFRWDEDAQPARGQPFVKEWQVERSFVVPPLSAQEFVVVVDWPDINTLGGDWYGNGRNLRSTVLAVDGIPSRMPNELSSFIEVKLSNPTIDGTRYYCYVTMINNDFSTHQIVGYLDAVITYTYLGDEYTIERAIYSGAMTPLLPGESSGEKKMSVNLGGDDVIGNINNVNSVKVLRFRVDLWDTAYETMSEEDRTIEFQVSGCDISQ